MNDLNFEKPEILKNILQNPNLAMKLALVLRNKNKDVPDNVIDAAISDPMMGVNFARTLAQDYVLTDEDVPKQLLKKVSESPKDSYYLAKYYKKNNQRIPEIIFQSVKNSQFFGPLQSDITEEDEEQPENFQKHFLKKIMQNSDIALQYVKVLLKNKKPLPDFIDNAFASFNDSAASRYYALELMEHNIPVSDQTFKTVAQDSEQSFMLAKKIMEEYKKLVPDEVIFSFVKDSKEAYASDFGRTMLNKRFVNQRILKIIENAIIKSSHKKSKTDNDMAQAGDYAVVYARIIGDLPNEKLMDIVPVKYLSYVAMNMLAHGKNVNQKIIDKIATHPARSFAFMAQYRLAYGVQKLPGIYKKIAVAAKKYEKETI